MLYRVLLKRLLFLLPAEAAHGLALRALRWLTRLRPLCRVLLPSPRPSTEVHVFGKRIPTPVGLAAGFDKDATVFPAMGALGFGFVEVGTLTGEGQPGNPRPRLFRLPADRALINRMGFNNSGAAAAAERLAGREGAQVVGVNVGKTKAVPEADAPEDYARSVRHVAPHADYLVLNVSSPNTPGLRNLQAVERLRPLVAHVRRTLAEACPGREVPMLVKIAPDLADADVDAVADLVVDLGLAGIVATNTTIAREGLHSAANRVEACGEGGLSGAPLKSRATEVLRRLRARVGPRLVLIASGGIESAEDAWERIRAGATLVQVYTALVYEGPGLPRRLTRGLERRVREAGLENIQSAVGVDLAGSSAGAQAERLLEP